MPKLVQITFVWCTTCALTVASGCSSSGPDYKEVHGKITLDGAPLKGKSVFYTPVPGTPGMGAGAVTLDDGTYKLLAVAAGATHDVAGIQAGSYRVLVTEPMFPQNPKASEGTTERAAVLVPTATRVESQSIPALYTKRETTPLVIEVGPDGGEINLELQTRP